MSEISSVIALGSGMYVVYWPCKGNSPLRPLFRPGAGRWPWSPGLPPQGPTLGSRNPAPVADCRSVGGGDALHIEAVGRGGEQSWGVSAAPPPRPPAESVGQPEEASPEEQQEEACAEEASGGEERPEDEGEEEAAYLDELPEPLLLRVLAELPAAQLVQACRLVCLRWKELVDGAPLWLLKCQQEGLVPQDGPEDERDHWQQFYFLSKRRRNLLRNPCGEGEGSRPVTLALGAQLPLLYNGP